MLDYDSMRSKVKRLTEKPDKDASKLPRAEKEADMVSLTDFLDEHRVSPPHASLAPARMKVKEKNARAADPDLASLEIIEQGVDEELVMPDPSELRTNPRSRKPADAGRMKRSSSVASVWGSNLLARFAEVPSATFNKASHQAATPSTVLSDIQSVSESATSKTQDDLASTLDGDKSILSKPTQRERADSKTSSITLVPTVASSDSNYTFNAGLGLDSGDITSTDTLLLHDRSSSRNALISGPRSFTTHILPSTPTKSHLPNPQALPISPVLYSNTFTTNPRNITPNPFFTPSELHDLMLPLKRAFLKQRADELKQAKAAYEQLNEQLSTELPQLIDLRVPYLDPSFEALVKIQLRFCAEAYSRMAQVQQYVWSLVAM